MVVRRKKSGVGSLKLVVSRLMSGMDPAKSGVCTKLVVRRKKSGVDPLKLVVSTTKSVIDPEKSVVEPPKNVWLSFA